MEDNLIQKLTAYKPSQEAIELIKHTKILLLVGPTGAGKGALNAELLKTNQYYHIVSHTTRPPRINQGIPEEDGLDYHFIDKATAEQMLDKRQFIEAKIIHGNLYGTSVDEFKAAQRQRKIALTDIDVQGIREYKRLDSKVMAIFLLPPNFLVWQDRLSKRYGDVVDAEDHKNRLRTALNELKEMQDSGYYIAVINDYMTDTYQQISDFIEKGIKPNQTKARKVAEQLMKDINDYLNKA